jgi:nitric oxide reductase subunit B
MSLKMLKWAAILCFVVAMAILLGGGIYMKKDLPPYPGKVVGPNGQVLFQKSDIIAGQDVYQRYGLMDHGAVWGHGSQRGPEFSATSLHLIAEAIGDHFAQKDYNKPYNGLDDLQKGLIDVKTIHETKPNRYDAAKDTLTLTAAQVEGLNRVKQHWEKIFKEGEQRYGFLPDTIGVAEQRLQVSRFFFWTAWVASTLRPGTDYSYTNNWPPDKRVGNTASTETYFYSIAGIMALLVVLGLFVYWIHRHGLWYGAPKGVALSEKLIDMPLTPSQFTAAKFFVVVILLFLVQTSFGGLLAHYTIHPGTFFLPIVAKLIPYSWAKTWHLQLMVFWIATTWLASAIYLAPIIGGREPVKQDLLVKLLFVAVLLVAVGSLTGEVLGIKGMLGDLWFWFGHQGWEFLELGRIWQILLFGGLIFWLVIVDRAVGKNAQGRIQFADLVLRVQCRPGSGLFRLRALLRQRLTPHDGRLLALVRGSPLGGKHL